MGHSQREPEDTQIRGGAVVTFEEVLTQAIAMLQRLGRVSYRALKRQFALDDAFLEDLKYELTEVQQLAVDHDGTVLIWTGDASTTPAPMPAPATSAAVSPPAMRQAREPLAYTPPYLAEKILTSRSALAGERKQVTVLFADLKGSMELLADRDPEEARQLLDPVLERMMAAVHRYEGTVNQVMGDGIMALFGAPIAHEDHAVRACNAALAMQEAIRRYSEEVRQAHGVEVQIRVGLNSGEVVVRAIGNDLHIIFMEQLAPRSRPWRPLGTLVSWPSRASARGTGSPTCVPARASPACSDTPSPCQPSPAARPQTISSTCRRWPCGSAAACGRRPPSLRPRCGRPVPCAGGGRIGWHARSVTRAHAQYQPAVSPA